MASHLARAEKMNAAGVNIQIRGEWREHARIQDPLDVAVAGGCATFAFDLTTARTGYGQCDGHDQTVMTFFGDRVRTGSQDHAFYHLAMDETH